MNIIPMNKFGNTLTDREDGKKAFNVIISASSPPYILDFNGVISLGSSFGDEIILKLAPLQGNNIKIININDGIRASVKRIIEETNINVELEKSE